eukprot:519569-Prymnesium_polylepis.2
MKSLRYSAQSARQLWRFSPFLSLTSPPGFVDLLQFFDLNFGLWSQSAVEAASCSGTLPRPAAPHGACIRIQAAARGRAARRLVAAEEAPSSASFD